MPGPELVDLDQQPRHRPAALALFAAAGPGRAHAVCGLPWRMGMPPEGDDLAACLGAIAVLERGRIEAALAICPYSEEQATIWGPVAASEEPLRSHGARLLREARAALRDGGYASVRALSDPRNRTLRALLLAQGFAPWKDTHVCERALPADPPPAPPGFRRASRRDHRAVSDLLGSAFPATQHGLADLALREREGYRHYLIEQDGAPVAAAAVQAGGRRAWLKLVAVRADRRGAGIGQALLTGVIAAEAALGHAAIGLEVLADNAAAVALFRAAGFRTAWSATILVAPL